MSYEETYFFLEKIHFISFWELTFIQVLILLPGLGSSLKSPVDLHCFEGNISSEVQARLCLFSLIPSICTALLRPLQPGAFLTASDIILRKMFSYFICVRDSCAESKWSFVCCDAKTILSVCRESQSSDASATLEQVELEPYSEPASTNSACCTVSSVTVGKRRMREEQSLISYVCRGKCYHWMNCKVI